MPALSVQASTNEFTVFIMALIKLDNFNLLQCFWGLILSARTSCLSG